MASAIFVLFQEINYDSKRGGVSIVTEKGESTTSHLLIQKAVNSDSGIYTCQPVETVKAFINVHILRGKKCQPVSTCYLKTEFGV